MDKLKFKLSWLFVQKKKSALEIKFQKGCFLIKKKKKDDLEMKFKNGCFIGEKRWPWN
jgi:hypothetical protein